MINSQTEGSVEEPDVVSQTVEKNDNEDDASENCRVEEPDVVSQTVEKNDNEGDASEHCREVSSDPNSWFQYFDASTCKYYYYNVDTQETVWEKPKCFAERPVAAQAVETKAETTGLSSILDKIDYAHSGGSTNALSSSEKEKNVKEKSCPYDWVQYFDTTSSKPYYYNIRTGETVWEKPKDFVEPFHAVSNPIEQQDGTNSDAYAVQASFSSKNGGLAVMGGGTYFEKIGRASDKQGRQLSAFFDLDSFEQNRQEALKQKKVRQEQHGGRNVDWKRVKQERKEKKAREGWLYEPDTDF